MLSIILSRRDFREYDQIISLYTKDKGKLELLSRGVKKITSKNAAHLEPFSFVFAEMVPGKEIDHLIKVQPVKPFRNIRKDLKKSIIAQQMCSIADRLICVGEDDVRVFELLKSFLQFLETSEISSNLLIDSFVVKLFHLLGFSPILLECVVCGKEYKDIVHEDIGVGKKPGFYFAGGGLICHDCRVKKEMIEEQIAVCGLKEISQMEMLLHADWHRVDAFQLEEGGQKSLHTLVLEFARYHSEKKVVDWQRIMKA
ncbi:MAG: DNA repair protein RecO [Candidatus Magasanikbacteria bacterium]